MAALMLGRLTMESRDFPLLSMAVYRQSDSKEDNRRPQCPALPRGRESDPPASVIVHRLPATVIFLHRLPILAHPPHVW